MYKTGTAKLFKFSNTNSARNIIMIGLKNGQVSFCFYRNKEGRGKDVGLL